MDLQQEQLARSLGAGHRVIHGGWRVDEVRIWCAARGLDRRNAPVSGQLDLGSGDAGDGPHPAVRADGHLRAEWVEGAWRDRAAAAAQWAELGLCPVRFGQGGLTARPCLRLDVGRSEAKSEGVTGAKLVGSPFGAVGPTLGARLRAFGPAFVEGSLEALVVFSRSEFLFDNSSVYDMPWVRVAARLAVGVYSPVDDESVILPTRRIITGRPNENR